MRVQLKVVIHVLCGRQAGLLLALAVQLALVEALGHWLQHLQQAERPSKRPHVLQSWLGGSGLYDEMNVDL